MVDKVLVIRGNIIGNPSALCRFLFLSFSFILLAQIVSAAPSIQFSDPTPVNGTIQLATYASINVSINDSSLNSAKFNWNGTNFTFYDDTLLFFMNLNNVSELGENSTRAVDISRNGLNFTIINATVTNEGKSGGALLFSPVSSSPYLSSLADISHLDNLTQMTVSVWAKSSRADAGTITILSKLRGGFIGGWSITRSSSERYTFTVGNVSTNVAAVDTITYQDTLWHHIVGIYNGTHVSIYVDGKVNKSAANPLVGPTADTPYALCIGTGSGGAPSCSNSGPASSWNGTLDDVMIWNRSLTDAEISQLYMTSISKHDTSLWSLGVNQTLNTTAGLMNGTYSFQSFASNGSDENSTGLRFLTVNTSADQPPASISVFPTNGSAYNAGTVTFMCNATDDYGLTNTTLSIWNSTAHAVTNFSASTGFSNTTNLTYTFSTDGIYSWSCQVYDSSSFSTWSSNRTLFIDSVDPVISLEYPANATTNSTSLQPDFRFNVTDSLASALSCSLWLQNSTGINVTYGTNSSVMNSTSTTITANASLAADSYLWWVNCTDNANTARSAEYNLTISTPDTILPAVNITYPLNQTYALDVSFLNYTASDNLGIGSCWYSTNAGVTNSSFVAAGINFTDVESSEGDNVWRVYCNDTSGNVNFSTITFNQDSTYPLFSSFYDSNGSVATSISLFNATVMNTNGTVLLQVNNTNYTASTLAANVYNVSVNLTAPGTYSYKWISWSNTAFNNYNESVARTYVINNSQGDSLVTGDEQCDDGNSDSGDGCSSVGVVESGYYCMLQPSTCARLDWRPPIGIPYPSFGIGESHTLYDGLNYSYNGTIAPYNDAGNGPYTHYVDNSVSCTDSNNLFGNHTNPRCSYPSGISGGTLIPGSVLEIHGGPYNSTTLTLNTSGTRAYPIFIRGSANNRPIIERSVRVKGAFMIFEHIDFDKNNRSESAIDIRPDATDAYGNVHHISLRNVEAHNYNEGAGGNGAMISFSNLLNNGDRTNNIVFFNNSIHSDNAEVIPEDSYERDVSGFSVSSGTEYIWIIDNHIYDNAGDSIGAGHAVNYSSGYWYVGRNRMHGDGENAIDFKEVHNITISQNVMYDYTGLSAGSDGTVAVVHYGPTYSPRQIWFLYNEISNATGNGIQIGGGGTNNPHEIYAIGNVIYNISNVNGSARGIISWGSDKIYVVGNTIYNTDWGIDLEGTSVDSQATIQNNIVANLKNSSAYHLTLADTSYRDKSILNNSLFYQASGSARISWGSSTYNVSQFQNATGKCSGCVEGDPSFTNVLANNFSLQSSSAAINVGLSSTAYDTFYGLYGLNISVDYVNTSRPKGSAWDIGAFEYLEVDVDSNAPSVSLLAPSNDTNISNAAVSLNATFTDDIQLANVTLYVWNSTSSIINQTTFTRVGTSNSSNISFSFPYNGTFRWNYLAVDNSSNSAWASTNYTIIISPPVVSSNDSDDDSDVDSGTTQTGNAVFAPTISQLTDGYTTALYQNWRVRFKIGSESHSLRLANITGKTATIVISSTPQTVTMAVEETRMFELDGDNYYDLKVTLESIRSKRADFTIQKVREIIVNDSPAVESTDSNPIPYTEINQPETESTSFQSFMRSFALIVLAIFIGVKLYYHYRHRRYYRKGY